MESAEENNKVEDMQATNWVHDFTKNVQDVRLLTDNEFDDYITQASTMAGIASDCFCGALVDKTNAVTTQEKAAAEQKLQFLWTTMMTYETSALEARIAKDAWKRSKDQVAIAWVGILIAGISILVALFK